MQYIAVFDKKAKSEIWYVAKLHVGSLSMYTIIATCKNEYNAVDMARKMNIAQQGEKK